MVHILRVILQAINGVQDGPKGSLVRRLSSIVLSRGYHPKYVVFSYSILSSQFFPIIWNNSSYYILKFSTKKIIRTMPFWRSKSEKSDMGYPKYVNFSYSILSYQFFLTIWNNSQYYILKVSTKKIKWNHAVFGAQFFVKVVYGIHDRDSCW